MIMNNEFRRGRIRFLDGYVYNDMVNLDTNFNTPEEIFKHTIIYGDASKLSSDADHLERIKNFKVEFGFLPNWENYYKYNAEVVTIFKADYVSEDGSVDKLEIAFNMQDKRSYWKANEMPPKTLDQYSSFTNNHIIALIRYIGQNYKFDENNYVLQELRKEKEDIEIKFYDFEKKITVAKSYFELLNCIPLRTITKLRCFEKVCRFLEYGDDCKNVDDKLWSDYFLRKEFTDLNNDFNKFINNILSDTDSYNNCSSDSDVEFIRFELDYKNQYKNADYSTLQSRIKSIDFSLAMNPFQVDGTEAFQRIIDTYARVTVLESNDHKIESKYIFVPNYFELIVLPISEIDKNLFDNFKLGNQKLRDAKFYEANGIIYAILCNNLGSYNPDEEE